VFCLHPASARLPPTCCVLCFIRITSFHTASWRLPRELEGTLCGSGDIPLFYAGAALARVAHTNRVATARRRCLKAHRPISCRCARVLPLPVAQVAHNRYTHHPIRPIFQSRGVEEMHFNLGSSQTGWVCS
jgi:hypothetical protein